MEKGKPNFAVGGYKLILHKRLADGVHYKGLYVLLNNLFGKIKLQV